MQWIVWKRGCLHYSELPNLTPRDVKVKYFAKRIEKCKIRGTLTGKGLEILEKHGCQKFETSLMRKFGFARVTFSHTRRHFNVQSTRRNCLVTGQGSNKSCKFFL